GLQTMTAQTIQRIRASRTAARGCMSFDYRTPPARLKPRAPARKLQPGRHGATEREASAERGQPQEIERDQDEDGDDDRRGHERRTAAARAAARQRPGFVLRFSGRRPASIADEGLVGDLGAAVPALHQSRSSATFIAGARRIRRAEDRDQWLWLCARSA